MTNNDILKVIDVITEPFFEYNGIFKVKKSHLIDGYEIDYNNNLIVFVPSLAYFDQKLAMNTIIPKLNELGFGVLSFLRDKIIISHIKEC